MEASSFLYDSFFPQLPVASDNFVMEDFLNIPNDDTIITDDTSSSSFTSSSSIIDAIFPGKAFSPVTSDINFAGDVCIPDLSVPCDDLPEREWLLNIVEETFSSEDLQKMELISGMRARNDDASESMWEMEPIPYVNGQNDDTLVTLQEMELVSDVKARNDDASKNMWEMELISDVREQNNDTLVTLQEMELISDVKTQKEDALEIVQNIDVKARNDDALETVQNREPILGVEAEIQHASKTVQKMEVISCTKGPNDDVSKTMEKIEMISHVKGPNSDVSEETHQFHFVPNQNSPMFDTEVFVPAKSRSKRPCGPPSDWTSRLLLFSPTTMSPKLEPMPEPEPELELELEPKQIHEFLIPTLNQPSIGVSSKKPTKSTCRRKENNDGGSGGDGRRCLHCATDKTPQWRTGPMGPKTLCNACGVRYKSGRLVPEYRPAASPTFVMAKHSNSHRKVLELRRQKEMEQVQHHHHHHHQQQEFFQHHHHPNEMLDMNISNLDGCLIYQHVDPNFRQLI